MLHHVVTFNFGSAKVCSPAIFDTSFSYDKDIWISATNCYMHFYIIVLFVSPDESRGYLGFSTVTPPQRFPRFRTR